jgi:hypothetical protein
VLEVDDDEVEAGSGAELCHVWRGDALEAADESLAVLQAALERIPVADVGPRHLRGANYSVAELRLARSR